MNIEYVGYKTDGYLFSYNCEGMAPKFIILSLCDNILLMTRIPDAKYSVQELCKLIPDADFADSVLSGSKTALYLRNKNLKEV